MALQFVMVLVMVLVMMLVVLLVGAYTYIGVLCFNDMCQSELYPEKYGIDFVIVTSLFWIVYQPIATTVYFYKRYKMIKFKEQTEKYKNK
jgi:hypothetical protein